MINIDVPSAPAGAPVAACALLINKLIISSDFYC
jgi:hypothetical protein